jgi:hypothetical protein
MKQVKHHAFFKPLLLLLSAAYLLYTLTNIFLLPRVAAQNTESVSFCSFHARRNFINYTSQSGIYIQLGNKCLLPETQLAALKFSPVFPVDLYKNSTGKKLVLRRPQTCLLYNKQPSYLSYHMLRI